MAKNKNDAINQAIRGKRASTRAPSIPKENAEINAAIRRKAGRGV